MSSTSHNLKALSRNIAIAFESEMRSVGRRKLYISDGMLGTLTFNDRQMKGHIVDLSAEGFGMFIEGCEVGAGFETGTVADFEFMGGDYGTTHSVVIAYVRGCSLGGKNGTRIGGCYSRKRNDSEQRQLRDSNRFEVQEFIAPTAFCQDEFCFQELLYFRAVDVSSTGVGLLTSLRNKMIFPGMPLNLQITIPTQGEFCVRGIVKYTFPQSGGQLRIGLQFSEPSRKLLEAISEYLFMTTDVSVDALRRAGFAAISMHLGLSFRYPETQEDWLAILELRKSSYQGAGKFSGVTSCLEMLDEFDAYSRHIMCKTHGEVKAAGRVVFVNGDMERSEHYRLGVQVPEWIWKGSVCEFSRACTHSEYRGSDLLIKLVQHMGRIAFQGGANYVLANCNDNMWPTYKRLGFMKLGVRFDAFGTVGCNLMYLDIKKMILGSAAPFLTWNQVVLPISEFVTRGLPRGIRLVTRLSFHRFLFPWFLALRTRLQLKKLRSRKKLKSGDR